MFRHLFIVTNNSNFYRNIRNSMFSVRVNVRIRVWINVKVRAAVKVRVRV